MRSVKRRYFETKLMEDIEQVYHETNLTDIDEIVVHLTNHPAYSRQKRQTLTSNVRQLLPRILSDHKRLKKTDTSEENVEAAKQIMRSSENSVSASTNISNGGLELSRGKGGDGIRFRDLGGIDEVVDLLIKRVLIQFYQPQLPQTLGLKPISGILLYGPPGCGKTTLAHAIANELGFPFYSISSTELVSGVSGASEENIRELFSKAYRTAPSVVFIDEIEVIASKRENLQKQMEHRIVSQLMTCMDELHGVLQQPAKDEISESSDCKAGRVLVIGATNRPDALDAALRRPGRFDYEICLAVPDEDARTKILSVLTSKSKFEGDVDLLKIARATPGFVGTDLTAVVNEAGNLAMKNIINNRQKFYSNADGWWKYLLPPAELEKLKITMANLEEAVKIVQPSTRREGVNSVPDVTWEDIGGNDWLRDQFKSHIINKIKYPEISKALGGNSVGGFLLYGPPGCGKTLIAKAIANEAGATFIHIEGPELLNKYVGETELAIRTIFSRARTCPPCIIFFDEIDALATKRGTEGGWVVTSLLTQLLTELDGGDKRDGVYVIGATNRLEVMDPAILRPGRLGKLFYVPLPSPDARGLILKALAKNKRIDATVDLVAIAESESCRNLSGADLNSLMEEAVRVASDDAIVEMQQSDNTAYSIKASHFERVLRDIHPSVSEEENQYYEQQYQLYKRR